MMKTKLRPSGSAGTFGAVLLLCYSLLVGVAAGDTTFPAMPASPGPTIDGATNALFSYAAVPAETAGDTLRSWRFYAGNTNMVQPVIFNSSGAVVGYGARVQPVGTGYQTVLFGLQAGTDVLAAGYTVGFYYPGAACIPFSSGGPTVTYKPLGNGEQMVIGTTTTQSAGARTYSASYTSSSAQVTLAPPASAPGGSAITDGSTSTYYAYTPVTSQYDGYVLGSISFYAKNTNALVPVIYSAPPFSRSIGYGQSVTPLATNALQTFRYIPVVGTDVLATGQMLGWYTPGAGSVAFNLTGGTGILNNPNVSQLQTNVFPTSAIPNRSYYVGFTAALRLPLWRETHSLPADGSQDLATPAGDGVANLLKYAFNMAPNPGDLAIPNVTVLPENGTAGLPFIHVDEQGRLVVEFVRWKASSNAGITYTVETGDDLTSLTPLDLSGAAVESIDARWERVTVVDPTVTAKRFGRLRVAVQ